MFLQIRGHFKTCKNGYELKKCAVLENLDSRSKATHTSGERVHGGPKCKPSLKIFYTLTLSNSCAGRCQHSFTISLSHSRKFANRAVKS